jgi:hypothetical protein
LIFRISTILTKLNSNLTSPIVTLVVGRDKRLFAAHEDVLARSPFFSAALKGQFLEASSKQVELPDEYVFPDFKRLVWKSD